MFDPLSIEQILAWAEEHRKTSGQWPDAESGVIVSAERTTRANVDRGLKQGLFGLPGGISLALLLAKLLGRTHASQQCDPSKDPILAWADEYHRRTGNWPASDSGEGPDLPTEE